MVQVVERTGKRAWWSESKGRAWRGRRSERLADSACARRMTDELLADEEFARMAEVAGQLTREHVIAAIQDANPAVGAGFLEGFDDVSLVAYLERLTRMGEPRGRESAWRRPAGQPAIREYTGV